MDQFVVSARKYRPSTFATVIGQSHITTTLQNAIRNNHLAHAFLFCGPRGVGKTTCARILAKTINCEKLSADTEPCNECESCVSFNEGASLNIYELDAASNNSVDDMRNLTEQVRIAPHKGSHKIYIVDEVHMLSPSAFNAFLKTLEEPPPYAIFILATTEKHKIIPTILSRCQIYDFNRIGIEDIAGHLAHVSAKEGVQAEPDALQVIAQKADGALRDALSIFDQIVSFSGNVVTYKNVTDNLNILDYDYYFRLCSELLNGSVHSSLLLYNEIIDKGFDGHHFISGLSGHFRNLLMCKNESTLVLLEVSNQTKEKYKQQAASFQAMTLFRLLDISNSTDIQYKQSKNPRLSVELALMKMCMLFKSTSQIDEAGHVPEKKKEFSTESLSNKIGSTNTPNPGTAILSSVKPDTQTKVKADISSSSIREDHSSNSEIKTQIESSAKPATETPINSTRKLKSTLSIRSIPEITKPEVTKVEVMSNNSEAFTFEQLMVSWKKYAEKCMEDGKHSMYAALTKVDPILKENFQIELEIDTKASFPDKSGLLRFLRFELKNDIIDLTTTVKQQTEENAPYTTSEKFLTMNEKNPALDALREAFNLKVGV